MTADHSVADKVDGLTYDEEGKEKKAKSGSIRERIVVVLCILVTELCERLTYYSIVANLVLFCTNKLGYTSQEASTIVQVFAGSCYIIPVFGGYIADSISGKYNAILGSGLIYLLGLFLLPASAVNYVNWFGTDLEGYHYDLSNVARRTYFLIGLALIAIGTGGIKANVGPFGAQQLEDMGPESVQSFFNWFYWFINAGAFISYTAVAYIEQNIGFEIGFLIPLSSMTLAVIILISGRKLYIHHAPQGSVLTLSAKAVWEGLTRKKFLRIMKRDNGSKLSFLDGAKKSYGGSYKDDFIDGIMSSLKVIPVFLTIIFYWAIYTQMTTTFFLQGTRMNARIGNGTIPVAFLNVFDVIIILLLIPIMDKGVYKLMAKYQRNPTPLQRIGIGMILAAASVGVAGILEIFRKKEIATSGGMTQVLAGKTYNASHISLFAQIPEFALIGASEVFTSITGYMFSIRHFIFDKLPGLEYAYSQAPVALQGMLMGLFLMTSGLGNYVSTAIIEIVNAATKEKPWFPDEINYGNLEYLFFLLTGLMLLDFLIFILIARFFINNSPSTKEVVVVVTKTTVDDGTTDETRF